MLSMVSITEGKMAPFPGGVLIRAAEAEGGCVGRGVPVCSLYSWRVRAACNVCSCQEILRRRAWARGVLGAVGVSGASGDEDECHLRVIIITIRTLN